MDDMCSLKKKLKKWESTFMVEFKRKPERADIEQAPEEIQDAYKRYKELKENVKPAYSDKRLDRTNTTDGATATEGSNESEVWGHEFDKKTSQNEKKKALPNTTSKQPIFLQNLGKKMFEKSLKLNRHQSISHNTKQWRKPDTPRRGLGPSPFSSPVEPAIKTDDGTQSNEVCNDQGGFTCREVCEVDTDRDDCDIPVIQLKNVKNIVCKTTNLISGTKRTHETELEPCLERFQTKSKQNFTSVLPKNLSKLVSKHKIKFKENFDDEVHEEDMEVDDKDHADEVASEQTGHSWHVPVKDLIIEDMVKCDTILKQTSQKLDKESKTGCRESKSCFSEKTVIKSNISTVSARVQNNTNKVKEKCNEKDDIDLDKVHVFDQSDVEKSVPSKKTNRVARKRKKISSDEDESNDCDNEGEDGSTSDTGQRKPVATKSKSKTATKPASKKQKTNISEPIPVNVDDDQSSAEGSVSMSRPVAKKPTKTKAVSNDNFIRLNMKVKTYKRKGRQMTGQQYRRQMWKQKMKDRSKSYGDACFKCGQSGHWANKCPGVGNKAPLDKEPVVDEDFPSMQEAAMIAKGIRLEQNSNKIKHETGKLNAGKEEKSAIASDSSDALAPPDDVELEIQSEIVRTRKEAEPVYTAMEPLLDEDQDTKDIPDFVQKGLKKFGYDSFRPGQKEAVMRILKGEQARAICPFCLIPNLSPLCSSGQSTLVVLSTGGGKSLCYQLPAYLYAQNRSCITLVISPLVSLMEDQVTGLPNGVRGVCLHTNMTANQRENVLSAVKDGKAQFLLVSPEAIAGGSMTLISSMSTLPQVAFVCIDEAHCLSEWSHNFRPSYLRLCKVLREKLGIQCFLGLTATATLSTAADVSRHLNITDFKTATVRGSPIPVNLQLSVSRDEDREQALINLLQGDRFCNLDSIIIYCTRRDQTDKVATIIRTCLNKGAPVEARKGKSRIKLEWDAESYHAGLSPAQRKRVQNAFMSGKLRVVVATVAFGMGLDKADVRGIIHYNMPKSFESYVQEIGRAGRDGNTAQCHVFLDSEGKDLCELRRHTYANTVDYKTLKKLVQKIFSPCRCREVHEKHAKAKEEASGSKDKQEHEFDDADEDLIDACNEQLSSKVLNHENDANPTENKLKAGSTRTLDSNCDKNMDTEVLDESTNQGANTISEVAHANENEYVKTTNVRVSEGNVSFDKKEPVEEKSSADRLELNVCKERLCPGHERALPIEQTVMELDVKEEGISTLLCYLELHSSQWLENLPSVYANCKIQCYGGPSQLQTIAKKCPPVAVAVAKARKEGKNFSTTNILEFPVVEISDCMGWDSGPVKKELKLLQWDFSSGTAPKRTGVMIEFTDLSYHFRSPGDFASSEMDDILEFLHARVQRQEKSEIYNLSKLYKSLKSVSHKNYWMCADTLDMSKNDKLKAILNEYFDSQSTNQHEDNIMENLEPEPVPEFSQSQVLSDIHQFINLYGVEHTLTGRAIARVFHGISSPCFPAQTWGKVRRFWRRHLNVDFNELMKIATKELILLRR